MPWWSIQFLHEPLRQRLLPVVSGIAWALLGVSLGTLLSVISGTRPDAQVLGIAGVVGIAGTGGAVWQTRRMELNQAVLLLIGSCGVVFGSYAWVLGFYMPLIIPLIIAGLLTPRATLMVVTVSVLTLGMSILWMRASLPFLSSVGLVCTIGISVYLLYQVQQTLLITITTLHETLTAAFQRQSELDHLRDHQEALIATRTAELEQRTQELQHALQIKDEFVSVVSHELRTPLTAIIGALGAIADVRTADARRQRLMHVAVRNSEYLAKLINDILSIQAFEHTAHLATQTPLDLGQLVDHAVELSQPYASTTGVSLVVTKRMAEPVLTDGDEYHLLQVLNNLLSNACKYAPPDSQVDISITTPGTMIRVGVRDYGPGIPETFQAHVFERFTQADTSNTRARSRGGTGLGLAIARTIVERLDGEIGFHTAQGVGTEFYFTLPRCVHDCADRHGGA